MRHERDFLETLQTYVKVTQARLMDGRIIDAHEELQIIEKMISQRKEEVNGTAAWENISKQAEPTLGVAEAICDKYPDTWDAEAEGKELSESEICRNCPLNGI